MDTLWQDARFALRTLRKNLSVTILATVSLALAIAGNTTVFSMVYGFLYRPLPYEEVDRLVLVGERTAEILPGQASPASPANYLDFVERQTSFEQMAAIRGAAFTYDTGGEQPEQITGSQATPGFFAMFGIEMAQGRGFAAEEGVVGRDRVVVLSHAFWTERFGGQGNPAGETLKLNGEAYEVVGVLTEDFEWIFNPATELWVPLAIEPGKASRQRRNLFAIGRLRDGVETETARAEMESILAQLAEEHPDSNRGYTANVLNMRHDIPDSRNKMFMTMLQGALVFVLLIACANVANLLLSRSQQREREMAIRNSMGASRGRIVRQLVTESMVMAGVAGVIGTALAQVGTKLIANAFAGRLPSIWTPTLDTGALLFSLAVTLLGGALFGLAPVLQSLKFDLLGALKDGTQAATAGGKKRLVANTLVIAEIALALTFLAGGGILIKSFHVMQSTDPGFESENVLMATLLLPESRFGERESQATGMQQLRERLAAVPGVRGVAVSNATPRTGVLPQTTFAIDAQPASADQAVSQVGWMSASSGFFEALGIAVLQGRSFTPEDNLDAPRVAVINEAMAARHWPGESALGERLTIEGESREVVGIVKNVRHGVVIRNEASDVVYVPWAQRPSRFLVASIKTEVPPESLSETVRREVGLFDANVAIPQLQSLVAFVDQFWVGQRVFTVILSGFGFLALALAALGTYGVLAYSVARRTHEIGVRIALGADRGRVVRMVTRQGMTLGGIGLALGGVFVFWVTKLITALLQGFVPVDVWQPVAGVGLLLVFVTLVASFVPARRAAGVDPIEALRCE